MRRREVRKTAHPGAVIHGLVHLHHVLSEGYAALRDSPHTEETTKRERVVAYFILHGIVESLGQVREVLTLLKDTAPSLADIDSPFEIDLNAWTRFRDDSAHIIDRTHRVSGPTQNNAIVEETGAGYNTDTLSYNWETDTVQTGALDKMELGPALQKVEEILFYVNAKIANAVRRGDITPALYLGNL